MGAGEIAGAYRFDRFTLDLGRRALLGPDGGEVPLRPKSFALLRLLVENAGRAVDRDAIMAAVWPDVVVTDESITQCVRDLRKALGDEAQQLLRSLPKRSYLLAAEVVPVETTTPVSRAERRLVAILAADIVGYSRLIEQDEAGTLAAIKELRDQAIDPLLAEHKGRIVKLMGDGAIVEFASVVDAVACAVAIQKAVAGHQAKTAPERRIVFRIGVNLGDVVVDGDDLLGDGVNVAARLEQLCEPGGVLVSGTAFDHLQGRLGLPLEFTGEQQVKNIARPVRAYRVRLDGIPSDRMAAWAPARWTQRRLLTAVAALFAAVFLGGMWWFWPAEPPPGTASALPSVAVLPFDDMSGQSATSYFGDGVAEDIISMLSRVPELRVVARNSSFTFKGKPVDVREVGEKLGVTHVLEGSVRKDADRLRIVAQLVDAKTGEHVWAERFDRSGTDPLALQDEVTERVVTALAGDVGALRKAQYSEAWGKDHASLGEYDYFLRAEDLMRRLLPETNEQAVQIATEGLVKFPNSALLKLELAHAYFLRGWNAWSDDLTAEYRQAGKLVREAMAQTALSPLERRWGHIWSAFIAVTERKFELALGEAEAAIELSPYDAYWLAVLSQISIMAGKPAQALEWIDRAASLDPNPDPATAGEVAFYRGWALAVEGKLEDSLAAWESDHREPEDQLETSLQQAIVLNRLGRTEEAAAKLKEALAIEPKFTQVTWRDRFFYSDPGIVEREIADLASLGLPEK